jgi:hypothetical protein
VDSNKVVETTRDDQWKEVAPELNFESHSKGSEYLCRFLLCHYGNVVYIEDFYLI